MAPPVFTLPPPRNKKQAGRQNAFRSFINAHKSLKPYAQQIWNSASQFGLDPVYFAALVQFESGGNPTIVSKAGAVGLGQVVPGKKPPWMSRAVTAQDLRNPGLNLKVAAWYFSQGLGKYGSYDATYNHWYNPGYGPGYSAYQGSPFASVPKGYVPIGGQSPEDKAVTSVTEAQAKASLGPVQRQQARQFLDPIYLAYTGRTAKNGEISKWLQNPVSAYQLQIFLSDPHNNPRFYKSPVWTTNAPSYESAYKDIFGPDAEVDRNAIRYGIVHNLGSTGFQQYLRDRPGYETSQEFRGKFAQYQSVYQNIYGAPDATGKTAIKQAVRSGWNQDQWEQYLRAQPEYTSSGEYKLKAQALADRMGLIQGPQTVLGAANGT